MKKQQKGIVNVIIWILDTLEMMNRLFNHPAMILIIGIKPGQKVNETAIQKV